MLKHIDDIRKSAKERAQRRWQNYATEKAFKAARQEAAEKVAQHAKEPKEPEPADVISREKPDGRGSVVRAQTKFAKYIREMLDDHKYENERRNQIIYALSIRRQRYRLLKEKLRRLEVREAQRVAAQHQHPVSQYLQQRTPLPKKDLFS
jgi:hypothetical protein